VLDYSSRSLNYDLHFGQEEIVKYGQVLIVVVDVPLVVVVLVVDCLTEF
jgi:hypothetical protein